ncbi:FAD/NAD(P)-binding domain-containing protein [Exidia glandulosa HHB12029]|uniref:FAD/NAD(P)-binding domain-containing protein n=1 Tax=Exidia glandulosa HHB12029 TaxID=1314781 RepID=A0A165KVR8_EXIGL|nr:FAD/NAD(P)-binding domain-containing protein [Exidia glandulosa HHB12029]
MGSPEVAIPSRPSSSLGFHPELKVHSQGLSSPSRAFLSLPVPTASPADIALSWLRSFSNTVLTPSADGLSACFALDCHWRDLLALSWDLRTVSGQTIIAGALLDWVSHVHPRWFRLQPGSADLNSPYDGLEYVSGSCSFETDVGICSMRFNLVNTARGWKAWTVVSSLDALKKRSDSASATENGAEDSQRDPTVVIVGAGQCGLAVAARLAHLGIKSLLIERDPRIGDNWRNRYSNLCLNTPTKYSELPFMSFPSTWSRWPSGKALAEEMEDYPRKLGLQVWTSSSLVSASFDAPARVWNLQVRVADGETVRRLSPRHLVIATGVGTLSGLTPRIPRLHGRESFSGTIMHSSAYQTGQDWNGKHAVVVGAACSGQDIAQDLHKNGAQVTIIQRSPISIISRERLWVLFNGEKLYGEQSTFPTDVADRMIQSTPTSVSVKMLHPIEQKLKFMDQELYTGLQKRGFLLPDDDDSFLHRLLVRRGGYYVNGGTCELIMDGKIAVKAAVQPSALTGNGVLLSDGTEVRADLVVFATGYDKNDLRDYTSNLLGPDVAKHVTATGLWDKEREISGVWRPSGHEGLWFAGGDLFAARFYSQVLALQIKAREDGLV